MITLNLKLLCGAVIVATLCSSAVFGQRRNQGRTYGSGRPANDYLPHRPPIYQNRDKFRQDKTLGGLLKARWRVADLSS